MRKLKEKGEVMTIWLKSQHKQAKLCRELTLNLLHIHITLYIYTKLMQAVLSH